MSPIARPPLPTQTDPWQRTATRKVYANPWISLREDHVVNPGGKPGIYGVVSFNGWATGVLPLFENGDTVLVGQWRYPLGRYSWELPEGGGAKDTPPEQSARREMREETGLEAAHWQPLLKMDLSNCVTDEQAFCFLAWGLTQHQPQPDEDEQLATHRLPFAELLARVDSGEVTDSLTVAMVLKVSHLALRGALPTALPAETRHAVTQASRLEP